MLSWSAASSSTPVREKKPSPFFLSFYPFVSRPLQRCQLKRLIENQVFFFRGCFSSNPNLLMAASILLPKPAQSQHSLCRAVSADLVCEPRCRERENSRAGSQGCYSVLFVAATHCYRVVAAWRRSSLLFLSLFFPPTHTNILSLSCSVTCSLPHTHCLCTSVLPPTLPLLSPLALSFSSPSEY